MKGARIAYTVEELAFVCALSALPRELIAAELATVFGRTDLTTDHVKALCTRNGWGTRATFTAAEDAIIRARYPDEPTATIAAQLGRTIASVYRRANALGVAKSAAFLASAMSGRTRGGVGVATRFQKGQTPQNKGLRRPGWAPGRMKETQFGTKPVWNHQPIGSTRIDSEGYEWTKLQDLPKVRTDVNWRPTHTLRWEAVHGPVPKGHALKCLDGNRLNTSPENWESVHRGVLARLNGGKHRKRVAFDAAPAELKPTVMALAKLEHAASTRRVNSHPRSAAA